MAISCTTFIDESGNTGDNLKSTDQKFFTLAAVTVPNSVLTETSLFFEAAFNTVRETMRPEDQRDRYRGPSNNIHK